MIAMAFVIPAVHAQTTSTAQRRLDLSAFVLLSGTDTGLGSSPYADPNGIAGPPSKNLTLSLGADLGFYSSHSFELQAEVRGGTPVDSGTVDGQKSILGGLRVTHEPGGSGFFGRVRPYGTLLAGRGQIDYQNVGYLIPGTLYISNNSAVYAAGLGTEVDVTRRFAVRVDAQFQRWNTPVTADGALRVAQGGVGLVYRYGTGSGPR